MALKMIVMHIENFLKLIYAFLLYFAFSIFFQLRTPTERERHYNTNRIKCKFYIMNLTLYFY